MYLIEHDVQPKHFGSIPAAMYWAVVTVVTVGYGDVVPVTPPGKLFTGFVMMGGLIFFALPVAIIATGFLAEIRRRDFIVNYGMVARVPAFAGFDAATLAELVGLLRARRFLSNSVVFQKTVGINDYYLRGVDTPYPLGQIQSQGRTHGVMAQTVAPQIPLWAYDAWVSRGVDWLAMTEDLPRDENRVTVTSDGRIKLEYQPNNVTAHRRLVKELTRILKRLGYWIVMKHSHETQNTTHQCGTLCFGGDPRTSVLNRFNQMHEVPNVFITDGSCMTSGSCLNPSLTYMALTARACDYAVKELKKNNI